MKILELKVLRGPNYWSNYRKNLIQIKLDIGAYEELPSNKLPRFNERLIQLLPGLGTHRCSPGYEGGFKERLSEGTWLGHIVEHVALELQTMAGMDCGYGRTRSTGDRGVYHVVFSYLLEAAGQYAGEAAVRLVAALAAGATYDIAADIRSLKDIYETQKLGPSTQAIVDEALKRNIPVTRLNNDSLVLLGQGCRQKLICAAVTGQTSGLAIDTAADKQQTKKLLADAYIPVPQGVIAEDETTLLKAVQTIGYPLVIKPVDGNHGRAVETNITSWEEALTAFSAAQDISTKVIVEKYVTGDDYRLLVINYKLVAASLRTPAMVKGDGVSTIEELINEENCNPLRGEGHGKPLTRIDIDHGTRSILEQQGLTLGSVLPRNRVLHLKHTANISTGGTAMDVTDLVHPDNIFIAERIARLLKLDICGIDVISDDIARPLSESGAVIEINAGPGLRMHLYPTHGQARNVARPIVDMLYPENAPARIPLVAVTGTNGKTTTTRLVAHIARQAGHNVGFTSTDGIYLNDHLITRGDCSGPRSAEVVLREPTVDYAVLECARGGILRSGLGFDHCDISIVTNISEDHLGIGDIHTVEQLARVKGVVPKSTVSHGYAILNADDRMVLNMRSELDCNIALFGMDGTSPEMKEHMAKGGVAAFPEDGYFTLYHNGSKHRLLAVHDAPLTYDGTCGFMIQNILAAMLAAHISGFSEADITEAVKGFIPSAETTPGRLNTFAFRDFKVMLDYVHNEGGYKEIKAFLDRQHASRKIGIISATGDRRVEDIIAVGKCAAEIFDEIIINNSHESRGRTNEALTSMLYDGIRSAAPSLPVSLEPDELSAVNSAIRKARYGDLVFVSVNDIQATIEFIKSKIAAASVPDWRLRMIA